MLLAFYHFKLLSFVLRVGLEPTRPCGQGILSPSCLPFHHQSAFSAGLTGDLGAENETRTRDPDLGKVVLYQLSYFRILFVTISSASLPLKAGAKVQTFFHSAKLFLKKKHNPFITNTHFSTHHLLSPMQSHPKHTHFCTF